MNEAVLVELQAVLKRNGEKTGTTRPRIYDFVGILTKEQTAEMKKAIAETCETIN